jgi:hypothetical protein
METNITASCTIREHRIYLNGELVYEHPVPTDSLNDFLIAGYRHFEVQYPKFFKMDALCKLAFLTAELLLPATGIRERISTGDIGIVLANKSSSLLTDLSHQQSIQNPANHFPSPAVFVYTLPNIMIGEVSIRHQLTGENTLFVADAFEPDTLGSYVDLLLDEEISQACLCGWIEADAAAYESFFYLVEKQAGSPAAYPLPHHSTSINTLYSHSFNLN